MVDLQKVARSRAARLTMAGGLIAVSASGFAPYVFNDVSTQASINAPLIRLTSATNGTVADLPGDGTYFARPTPITLVALSQNTGQIADLRARAALAQAQIELGRRQLNELAAQDGQLRHRAAIFSTTMKARIGRDHETAEAALRSCQAERAELAVIRNRVKTLAAQGFMAPVAMQKADTASAVKENECRTAEAGIRSLAITQAAARSGVFLGYGYNDTPYAIQQADRILLQRQAIERMVSDAAADRRAATARLADALSRARYVAPAGTLVWATLASAGTAIGEGSGVLDLLDCRRRFVQVALPERRAESVAPHSAADVRLIGSDKWLKGYVVNITGAAGQRRRDLLAAVSLSEPAARQVIVEVALPRPAPDALDTGRNCDVGRMAEVRFSRQL